MWPQENTCTWKGMLTSWYPDISCPSDATAKGQELETVPAILYLCLEDLSGPHSDVLHRMLAHHPCPARYAGLRKALYTAEDVTRKGSEETPGYETHAFSCYMEQV